MQGILSENRLNSVVVVADSAPLYVLVRVDLSLPICILLLSSYWLVMSHRLYPIGRTFFVVGNIFWYIWFSVNSYLIFTSGSARPRCDALLEVIDKITKTKTESLDVYHAPATALSECQKYLHTTLIFLRFHKNISYQYTLVPNILGTRLCKGLNLT